MLQFMASYEYAQHLGVTEHDFPGWFVAQKLEFALAYAAMAPRRATGSLGIPGGGNAD